jgi:hypothetical protein
VRRLAILLPVVVVVLLLVLAQLILPGIAERRLRDRLARSGSVEHVEIDAFPAIELLWHHADTVRVQLRSYRSSGVANLSSLLRETGDVGSVDASAGSLNTGLLTLRDATLRKRGGELTGTARVTEADLRAALPFITDVQPVGSSQNGLTLRGTATLLGVSASVDATLTAQDGRIEVVPDVPFGGLATVQVFSDPRIDVQSVSGTPTPDGFTATARALLK